MSGKKKSRLNCLDLILRDRLAASLEIRQQFSPEDTCPAGGLLVLRWFIKIEELGLQPPSETDEVSADLPLIIPRVEGRRTLHDSLIFNVRELKFGAQILHWNLEVEF